ncbi:hypothetical protein [Roseomonas elaeocarpi]|uniref:Transmembrane protein n=1 Tax=Roseomonas elaeocarpi TaxID=907779 RepID=A0ABV6JWF3_9PROT
MRPAYEASEPVAPLGTATRRREAVGRRGVAAWLLPGLVMLAGLYALISTAVMVVRCWTPLPIMDQWVQLASNRPLTLGWLWSQHNEHRLFFPRLIFVADRWLLGERNILDLAAGFAMQLGMAWLLFRLAVGAGLRGGPQRLGAAGLALLAMFWAVQFENFTWGFQVQFFGVLLATAATVTALVRVGPGPLGALPVLLLGFVAAFTFSSGVLAPFVAVALAIWLGRPWRQVAVLALGAVLILGVYLIGYETPPQHASPADILPHLHGILAYTVVEIGAPFAEALGYFTGSRSTPVAMLTGAAGLILLLLLLFDGLRHRRSLPPAAGALLALALFALSMALLTATGRVSFGIFSAMTSRYATPVMLFWCCLLLLGSSRCGTAAGMPPQGPAGATAQSSAATSPCASAATSPCASAATSPCASAATSWPDFAATPLHAVMLLLAATVALSQGSFARSAQLLAGNRAAALPAVLAGVADEELLAQIYPGPEVPLQLRQNLSTVGTSIYAAPWANWLGQPLAQRVRLLPAGECRGSLDTAVVVDDPVHGGWRAQGQVGVPALGPRRTILLADGSSRIVGFGLSGFDGSRVNSVNIDAAPGMTGWVGAFRATDPATVRAFLLTEGGDAACPLGGQPKVSFQPTVAVGGPIPPRTWQGGQVDAIYGDQVLMLDGWALMQLQDGAPKVWLDTNLPFADTSIVTKPRPDVAASLNDPRLRDAGFRILLRLDSSQPQPEHPHLCIWTEDKLLGRYFLAMNRPDLCSHVPG